MANVAISIEEVSKRYRLGAGFDGALSSRLEAAVRAPLRLIQRERPKPAHSEEEFWALRNVSLELNEGETLGLIGPNGAGKSTLLKLLSQITPPTSGRIRIRGRVGTLLEVGTGFHPELTGRENVFLNGAILGMRRGEITSRFDEIVDFSGIEQFLDTPVKRYSSGMHVRLAFAVAAYLETEIMLVDEVLAVGDTAFQRKCLGKMDDVASTGKTIVFVSHNLSAVHRLCSRTVWLEHGRVMKDGPTAEVIGAYLEGLDMQQAGGEANVARSAARVGTGKARLLRAAMRDADDEAIDRLRIGQPWSLAMMFEVIEPIEDAVIEVGICEPSGARVVTTLSGDDGAPTGGLGTDTYEIAVALDFALLPGDYWIEIGIHSGNDCLDFVERVINFGAINVPEGDAELYPWEVMRGGVRPRTEWTVTAKSVADRGPLETPRGA